MSLFRLLADLDGRIGRLQFWLGSIMVAAALLAIRYTAPLLAERHTAAAIVAFAGAFALFPWAVLSAKRAVDRGSVPAFGILLVCAIVLPGEFKAFLPRAWEPSLDTIALLAWGVALVDLGLLPSTPEPLAEASGDAKRAAWTPLPNTSPSIPSTPSR